MKKADLVASIAKEAKISKASAEKAVNAFTGCVTEALKRGDKLTLSGLGTFSAVKRKPALLRVKKGRKFFLHVAEPATANKILKSLKIDKVSKYAIYDRLSR
jgi:DNA-binding protein HU-beta